MKIIALAIVLFSTVAVSMGQQAADSALTSSALPPGPLLNRAPDFSQWTVNYKLSVLKQAPDESDSQTVVTKTKSIYHVQTIDGAGFRTDKWVLDTVQVTTLPNAQYPVISTVDNKDFYYTDYSKGDFYGFDWISKSNFVGIKKIGGIDCVIFQSRMKSPFSKEPATAQTITVQAAIDVKTRLPIYLKAGKAVANYVYGTPPAAMQVPPAATQALLDKWNKRFLKASVIPPP